MLSILQKIKRNILLLISYIFLRMKGIETKFGDVILFGFPIIHKCPGSVIKFGKGVSLISQSRYNLAGINHPVILATVAKGARIVIGNNSGISGSTIVSATSVKIGDNTSIGANTDIYDTDFHIVDPIERRKQNNIYEAPTRQVIIGNDVWIGSRCMILKGIEIGDKSIIGAGSIVTKHIPESEIWAGASVRCIGRVNE